MDTAGNGVERYLRAIQALQTRVIEGQLGLLDQVAEAMTRTILGNGRIFLFGTGHSHMLVEEGYLRAGGLAPVVPILLSSLMLHEDALLSGRLERMGGIAGPLLSRYDPRSGELLFVFSNSGVNFLPVEMAVAARERGLMVVAVCSVAYARVAPLSALGKRLFEVANLTLDNGGEPGDCLIQIEGTSRRVGPSSTMIGTLLWQCLATETALRVHARSGEAPVFVSANMPGAADYNAALSKQWRHVIRDGYGF